MSEWKINESKTNAADTGKSLLTSAIAAPFTMLTGNKPSMHDVAKTYTVENKSGETKQVSAANEKELGEKISKGFWD